MLFFIYIYLFILSTEQNLQNFVSGKKFLIFPFGFLAQRNPINFLSLDKKNKK